MKSITIDFDNTLNLYPYKQDTKERLSRPNKRLIRLIRQWAIDGYKLHIVTFRSENEKQEIEDFIKKHDLPIDSIVCTDSKPKIDYLKKLDSKLHVDDNFETTADAIMNNIDTMLPPLDEENVFKEEKFDIDFNNRKRPKQSCCN